MYTHYFIDKFIMRQILIFKNDYLEKLSDQSWNHDHVIM